ncbi:hypothetical protein MNBD_GAMMA11-2705 [hydrothermal vent metagenome]|uniref:Cytochrome c domain-containing protein n=1 Tax=hydrothermal vent metagenome TaxID=652676 RepID=A0A3B0WVE9_9ZZZZ
MKKFLCLLALSAITLNTAAYADSAKAATGKHSHDAHEHKAKAETKAKTQAANHSQGQRLHDGKCTKCHQSDVYTRKDRTVKNLSALQGQVNNCMKGAAKAEWDQPQTTSVVNFLNDRYYKF